MLIGDIVDLFLASIYDYFRLMYRLFFFLNVMLM